MIKLYVIDDDKAICKVLRRFFSDRGISIETFLKLSNGNVYVGSTNDVAHVQYWLIKMSRY